ncbi:MAG: type II toxin-antitoxin system VapC family toxin [Pseudomonadota bacterium]
MNTFLIDTHIILWWFDDDGRLGSSAKSIIADGSNTVFLSIASLWEIAIKHGQEKLALNAGLVASRLPELGIQVLPINTTHLSALEQLPMHHRDPFDRLLISQSLVEKATLITADSKIPQYGIPCLPA